LLVVFIVTTKVALHAATPLDLPQAAHGEAVQLVFSLTVDPKGGLRLDGEQTTLDALATRAKAALEQDPQVRGVIQADAAVSHGRMMAIMDTLRGAGMNRIAFATQPPSSLHPSQPLP